MTISELDFRVMHEMTTLGDAHSLASAPSNGSGLTRVLNTGPVTSHAAPARPPQPPEHRIRRSTSPTVRPAP
jgi:hypothetical protein